MLVVRIDQGVVWSKCLASSHSSSALGGVPQALLNKKSPNVSWYLHSQHQEAKAGEERVLASYKARPFQKTKTSPSNKTKMPSQGQVGLC